MKRVIKRSLFLLALLAGCLPGFSSTEVQPVSPDTLLNDTICITQAAADLPARGMKLRLHKRTGENKKLVAAALAFPLPFGFFGAHRIYLGTKPYVPFVYIGTLGGCALILPFIDFFTILLADEESFKRFENNPKVFMWNR